MKFRFALIVAVFLVFAVGTVRTAHAAPPKDACSLLTPAQVSAAIGVTVGSGAHTNNPSIPAPPPPLDKADCYWWQQGKSWLDGKRASVERVDIVNPSYDFDHPLLVPGAEWSW